MPFSTVKTNPATHALVVPTASQFKNANGLGNLNDTSDADKPVSTAQQAALDLKAPLASPALTGNPTAPTQSAGNNSTRVATTAFVTSAISTAVAGLLEFKGNLDCSANPNYPAADKGDTYYVSVAGKIGGASGKIANVGDAVIAKADNAGGTEGSVGTSWFILERAAVNWGEISGTPTSLSGYGIDIASQAEAEAGTEDTKPMTAQRVAQAIAASGGARVVRGLITLSGYTSGGTAAAPAVLDFALPASTPGNSAGFEVHIDGGSAINFYFDPVDQTNGNIWLGDMSGFQTTDAATLASAISGAFGGVASATPSGTNCVITTVSTGVSATASVAGASNGSAHGFDEVPYAGYVTEVTLIAAPATGGETNRLINFYAKVYGVSAWVGDFVLKYGSGSEIFRVPMSAVPSGWFPVPYLGLSDAGDFTDISTMANGVADQPIIATFEASGGGVANMPGGAMMVFAAATQGA